MIIKFIYSVFLFLVCLNTYGIGVIKKFPQHLESSLPENTKIGAISAFPGKFGFSYDDRAFYSDKNKSVSLFPYKDQKSSFDINKTVADVVIKSIKNIQPSYQIVNIEISDGKLTGHKIEVGGVLKQMR